ALAEARALTLDQNGRERPRSWTAADPPRGGPSGGRPAGVDRRRVLVRAAAGRHPLGRAARAGLHPGAVDAAAVGGPVGAGLDLPAALAGAHGSGDLHSLGNHHHALAGDVEPAPVLGLVVADGHPRGNLHVLVHDGAADPAAPPHGDVLEEDALADLGVGVDAHLRAENAPVDVAAGDDAPVADQAVGGVAHPLVLHVVEHGFR